jgi:aspartyl-tRNA(Asn)/glutamyl-tRNA(Gln) amidotransferase subunit C
MDKITSEIVEKVARLSRLSFSKEETMLYAEQLNSILNYMEKLNELNTDGIEPTMSPYPNENIMRDDIVIQGLNLDETLSNAIESERGYFKVPKMLQGE